MLIVKRGEEKGERVRAPMSGVCVYVRTREEEELTRDKRKKRTINLRDTQKERERREESKRTTYPFRLSSSSFHSVYFAMMICIVQMSK